MKKLLSMFAVVGLLLVGCGSGSSDDNTLTVLTNSGYKPYEMVKKDGTLYGFDIDVMNRAAEIAGYEIEWKDMDFDGIIDSIKTGKGDVAIAGMTPTADRAEEVDFSDIYYSTADKTKNMVLCKIDGDINETADIKGKKVGVQMGTAQEATANEIKKDYDLTLDARKSYSDMVQEIVNGKIDFMIIENATATELVNDNETTLKAFPLGVGTDPIGNAMAFKKGSELTEKFNAAIKEMIDSGEMDKLVAKYFK